MENQHDSQRRIYKIDKDWGRGFGVQAVFTAHPEDVERLQGETVYFGEIAGKHSEIELDIDADSCREIEAPAEVVEWIEANLGENVRSTWYPFDSFTVSGHNPFEYWEPAEEDE